MAWTAPRTWVSGEVVTAALLNTHLRDNLLAIGDPGAWATYSPAFTASTAFTLGNGTMTGKWTVAGKRVTFWARLLLGSTTSFTGGVTLSVPTAAISATQLEGMSGIAIVGAGPTFDAVTTQGLTTTTLTPFANRAAISNVSPGTWQNGNALTVTGTYEAA